MTDMMVVTDHTGLLDIFKYPLTLHSPQSVLTPDLRPETDLTPPTELLTTGQSEIQQPTSPSGINFLQLDYELSQFSTMIKQL